MRAWSVLPLALALGVATRLVLPAPAPPPRAAETGGPELAARAEGLARGVAAQRAALADLSRDALELELAPAPEHATPPVPEDAEIEAAVRAWLAEHAPAPEVGRSAAPAAPRPPAADLAIDQVLAFLRGHEAFSEASEAMYADLRAAGRMDEVVAAVEAQARARPDDPDLQVELGITYLQKLFELGATPEAGRYAMSVDQAFGRALELDPGRRDARFLKAISLANWPPFLGKTGEAVRHFEVLIEEIESDGAVEGYHEAYLYLGNLHLRTDDRERALAVWKRGLEWFPEDEELLRQVALAEGRAN